MVEACPSEDELLELLDGYCARARAAELETHIAGCDECRELVAQMVRIAEQEQQVLDTAVVTAIAGHSPRSATLREEAHVPASARIAGTGPAPREGEWVFNDTYVVKRVLGAGGMGCVYEAAHRRLERRFAIKVLAGAVALDPTYIARFRSEAEITSRLEHPNIVEVVDFDYHEEGFPYLVMELLEGEPLGSRISRTQGPLPLADIERVLSQVAGALDAAHSAGVVHRDLTPQNVFLCERDGRDDFVKVLDFGVSKLAEAPALTQTRTVLGTPHFMSPEQADGRGGEADRRSDIFSMGTMLYQMLTRRVPFSGRSVPSVLYAIVHHDPDPPSRWRPDLPLAIERVVLRALSKEPARRPSSMGELARAFSAAVHAKDGGADALAEDEALADYVRGEPVPTDLVAAAPSDQALATRAARPGRWRQAATIAVGVLLGALVTALALRGGGSASERAGGVGSSGAGSALALAAATADAASRAATPPVHVVPAAAPGSTTREAAAGSATPEPAASGATPAPTRTGPGSAAAGRRNDPVRIIAAPRKRRPRVRARARARVRRERGAGVLHVQTRGPDRKPLWANVYLDGKLVGQTALTLEHVAAGRHVVVVKRSGYRAVRRVVRVRSGARASIALRLRER